MRLIRKSLLILCALFMITLIAGCNKSENKSQTVTYEADARVINVRLFKRGYGADWIYELKRQFEKTYSKEKYKINVLTPSPDMKGEVALSELALGYESNHVDLFIVANVRANSVGVNNEILKNGKPLAEEIEETVYNQKAIKYDGTEEDKTVGEKLTPGAERSLRDYDGTMYAFNWAASAGGLVVNKKKLDKYGLNIPITTDEFFNCIDSIYLGTNGVADSETTKTFPVTYPQSGSYVNDLFSTWQAQYDLVEYDKFWSMNDDNGEYRLEDGYEVFNSPAIESSLSKLYRYLDYRISSYGSTTQSLDQAQAAILKDKNGAVFMSCGDWYLNEVKLNYGSKLDDITYTKIPINSDLGKKLFGAGSSYNLSDVDADRLLSKIASLSDEDMDLDQIIAEVKSSLGIDVGEEDALEVCKARGIYFTYGLDHMAYITKGTPNKDICELVLRMMASDDFAYTFSEFANVNSPYSRVKNTSSKYEFVRQASKITVSQYAKLVEDVPWSGLREKIAGEMNQDLPKFSIQLVSNVQNGAITVFDGNGKRLPNTSLSVFDNAAHNLMIDNYNYVKNKWQSYVAGISK